MSGTTKNNRSNNIHKQGNGAKATGGRNKKDVIKSHRSNTPLPPKVVKWNSLFVLIVLEYDKLWSFRIEKTMFAFNFVRQRSNPSPLLLLLLKKGRFT
jgi:hypothetical protein